MQLSTSFFLSLAAVATTLVPTAAAACCDPAIFSLCQWTCANSCRGSGSQIPDQGCIVACAQDCCELTRTPWRY